MRKTPTRSDGSNFSDGSSFARQMQQSDGSCIFAGKRDKAAKSCEVADQIGRPIGDLSAGLSIWHGFIWCLPTEMFFNEYELRFSRCAELQKGTLTTRRAVPTSSALRGK